MHSSLQSGPAPSGPAPAPAPAPATGPAPAPVASAPRPPQSNLDALSGYAADFLTSLNKDQLTSFLRVYFMYAILLNATKICNKCNTQKRTVEKSAFTGHECWAHPCSILGVWRGRSPIRMTDVQSRQWAVSQVIYFRTKNFSKNLTMYHTVISKTYPRHIQDILKTCPRHIQDVSKTYPRHVQDMSKTHPRRIQDVSKTYPRHIQDIIDGKFSVKNIDFSTSHSRCVDCRSTLTDYRIEMMYDVKCVMIMFLNILLQPRTSWK